jgi:hypothetical protein
VISLLCTLGKFSCKPTSILVDTYKNTLGLLSGKPTGTLGEHTLGELPGEHLVHWVNIHWVNCQVNQLVHWVNI